VSLEHRPACGARRMLLDGEGGDVDVTEGLRWLNAAAVQDEPQALRHLGLPRGRHPRTARKQVIESLEPALGIEPRTC